MPDLSSLRAHSRWHDKPHESSCKGWSELQNSQRLGSLFSSYLKQIQHEQRLQNLSSGLRVALQAEFWQRCALLVGALTPAVRGVLPITGSGDELSSFLCLLEGDWRLLAFDSGFNSRCFLWSDDFPFTTRKRWSSILCFDNPVYFLSLPNSTQRISTISRRVHSCSCSGALPGNFDNSRTSSLFSLTLSKRHLAGSGKCPGAPEKYSHNSQQTQTFRR